MRVWDLANATASFPTANHRPAPLSSLQHEGVVTISPRGRDFPCELFTGGNNRMVCYWDLRVGNEHPVQNFRHDDWVLMVEAGEDQATTNAPDRTRSSSSSSSSSSHMVRAADKAIHMWDARNPGEKLETRHAHRKLVTRFHSVSRQTAAPRLVSCSLDGSVKISSLEEEQEGGPFANNLNNDSVDKVRQMQGGGADRDEGLLSRDSGGGRAPLVNLLPPGFVGMRNGSGGAGAGAPPLVPEGATYPFAPRARLDQEGAARLDQEGVHRAEPPPPLALETTITTTSDYALCMDFDDTRLIVGGLDGSLYVYDFDHGRQGSGRRSSIIGAVGSASAVGSTSRARRAKSMEIVADRQHSAAEASAPDTMRCPSLPPSDKPVLYRKKSTTDEENVGNGAPERSPTLLSKRTVLLNGSSPSSSVGTNASSPLSPQSPLKSKSVYRLSNDFVYQLHQLGAPAPAMSPRSSDLMPSPRDLIGGSSSSPRGGGSSSTSAGVTQVKNDAVPAASSPSSSNEVVMDIDIVELQQGAARAPGRPSSRTSRFSDSDADSSGEADFSPMPLRRCREQERGRASSASAKGIVILSQCDEQPRMRSGSWRSSDAGDTMDDRLASVETAASATDHAAGPRAA